MSLPSLLIVDESEEMRALVSGALKQGLGCGVLQGSTLTDALLIVSSSRIDLIVSALGPGSRFGGELARKLNEMACSVPLIFYSIQECTNLRVGPERWTVVRVLNPGFEDLLQIVGGAFGVEPKQRKSQY